jgi:hypothetical protein
MWERRILRLRIDFFGKFVYPLARRVNGFWSYPGTCGCEIPAPAGNQSPVVWQQFCHNPELL